MLVLWFNNMNPLEHICYSADTYVNVQGFILIASKAQMLWCRGLITSSKQVLLCWLYCCLFSWPQEHRCYGAEILLLVMHRCYYADCHYLVFSSGMANRTLFQMCGRLYLPMYLLRVGLLTLMYMASLMALAIIWPSLSIILKFSSVVLWPVMFSCSKMGDDAFRCFLYLSSKVLADSPIFFITFSPATLEPIYNVTLICLGLPVLWGHQ